MRVDHLVRLILVAPLLFVASACGQEQKEPSTRRTEFQVGEFKAFVIEPLWVPRSQLRRWVWYAPTLGKGLPGAAEKWMFEQFYRGGIAVAGVDVGESFGSPRGRQGFQQLYEELTNRQGYHPQPVLLARSRGGLMLYSWAVEHPRAVAGIAGIYPVCNLASYPGVRRAAGAYGLTAEELQEQLSKHNPIDRLAPLAKAGVPILHIHGDMDTVVPLDANSAELAKRYRTFGGPVELEIVAGQGHNMWEGWFRSQRLTDFIIARAQGKSFPLASKSQSEPRANDGK
ncbi:MAG: prolyl oligopeptidase family serine peptidase [Planctomycetales bacterium]|nr:prolyl oligopeptidase family serine peptidase [Planctomycetales bacterium]